MFQGALFTMQYRNMALITKLFLRHPNLSYKGLWQHQNAGEVMVMGHLASNGLHVQRNKVREAIHAVDPEGVGEWSQKPIRRQVYSVPFPNYVWHIDRNHKLVRWRLVVHHGIDGYGRMAVFAKCSPNNRAPLIVYWGNSKIWQAT